MNYAKVDAALAAALDEMNSTDEPVLDVFIRLTAPASPSENTKLESFGIHVSKVGQRLLTAKLSPKQVADLTDQNWVRYVRLAEKLEPYEP